MKPKHAPAKHAPPPKAPHFDSAQRCARSVDNPSLKSIQAVAIFRSFNPTASRGTGNRCGCWVPHISLLRCGWDADAARDLFLSEASSATLPPRAPVTYKTSPAFAPLRRKAVPAGADPVSTISAIIPLEASAVSPPARLTPTVRASPSNPSINSSSQRDPPSSFGSAIDKNAARGSAPIAAISLNPRASVRCPTERAVCQSRRKCRPSRRKIRRHHQLMPARHPQDRAVVPNPQPDAGILPSRHLPNPRYDRQLTVRLHTQHDTGFSPPPHLPVS